MRSPVSAAVAASVRRPWLILAATLLIAIAALLIVIGRFAMTTDTSALISPDVTWRQHERAFDDAFPQLRDSMVIVIDGKTAELAEDGASRLAAALAEDTAHFRKVRRPDGGDFFASEGLLYASVGEVHDTTASLVKAQPMLGPLAADPSLLGIANALAAALDGVDNGSATLSDIDAPVRALTAAANDELAGKPVTFSWQRLFAGNGRGLAAPERRLILVRPVLDFTSLTPGSAAAEAVMAATSRLNLDAVHGVNVRLTGEVPLADQDFASLQENIGLVGAVMLAAMLVTLWFATRSVRLVCAIMATTVLGLLATLAIGLLAVRELNLISIAFIPLFVGLGVDFGIQICVRFQAERADDTPTAEALCRAAAAIGAPLTLAAGAIFLGFGAFLPTAYRGIAELGIVSGIGMVIALACSVTVLPALVMLFDPARSAGATGFAMLAPLDRLLERRRRRVLWAFAVAMLVSIALLPFVVFDFNPMDMRDPDAPAMRTLKDLTRDPDRTPQTISVLASSEGTARRYAQQLSTLPSVRQVVWLESFVPGEQQPKLAAIQDASMLLDFTINPFEIAPAPNDAAIVRALNMLVSKLTATAMAHPGPMAGDALRLAGTLRQLARGTPARRASLNAALTQPLNVTLDQIRALLRAQPVSAATLPQDLTRDWRTPDGRYRLEVYPSADPDDNAALEHFRNAVATVTPDISGLPVVTQASASTIARAFVEAGVIAFALVSILLLAVLRSLRETAFTLAPVILSIFLTLGTCVVIGQPLNFANIIAFPLLFGVGVAFHIYFVMAWRSGARKLLQSSLARAVLFSALATGTAFGSLWLSRHPGTASMGKILMISLIWTLICALVFEPALLGPPRKHANKQR